MKTIEDKQNTFLKRREIKIIIEAGKNPTMQEATAKVADQFKAAEENIAIKLVKGKFGRNTFLISANIYENKEAREKTEPKPKKKKGAGEKKEEKPAETAPAEQPAEQAEEKKEEPKEEKQEAKE